MTIPATVPMDPKAIEAIIRQIMASAPAIPTIMASTTKTINTDEHCAVAISDFAHSLHTDDFIQVIRELSNENRRQLLTGQGSYESILASTITVAFIIGAQLAAQSPTPSAAIVN